MSTFYTDKLKKFTLEVKKDGLSTNGLEALKCIEYQVQVMGEIIDNYKQILSKAEKVTQDTINILNKLKK